MSDEGLSRLGAYLALAIAVAALLISWLGGVQ